MTTSAVQAKPENAKIPKIPAIYVNAREAYLLSTDGEVSKLSHAQAAQAVHDKPVMVCHAPFTCKRLNVGALMAFDVLELFAFVHPATFAVPTPVGLAKALGLAVPSTPEDYPFTLMECAAALLSDLRGDVWRGRADPLKIAGVMGQNGHGWRWTPFIFTAFGQTYDDKEIYMGKADLNVWKSLPEWAEEAPPPPASHHPVTGEEARERLAEVIGPGAEARPAQMDYAVAVTAAFRPIRQAENPNGVLIEAGTGVGKTLGYLTPASLWAQKNKGTVWISTYTKNLQRQINQELDKIYPDPDIKDLKVAVRKGRENYLCLLNFEDVAAGASLAKHASIAIAAGLMARWAAATRDGDISGGDFPGWLTGLVGAANTIGLADRRGECIYSACDHYHRCYVERSVRKARHAEIVVANHALVLVQKESANSIADIPQHYVFDEGHHLFETADGAYASHLTARESYELRRWIRGNEGSKKSRMRGLKRRCEELVAGDARLEQLLGDIIEHSRVLTAEGWAARMQSKEPKGETEEFLLAVYNQVYARSEGRDGPYSLETETLPLDEDILPKATNLRVRFELLQEAMNQLSHGLLDKLNEQADTLDSDMRRRLDTMVSSLTMRTGMVSSWTFMLMTLEKTFTPPQDVIDWMEIERVEGRAIDVGLYRHFLDPMSIFAKSMGQALQGMVVTSATLRDGTDNEEENWKVARDITGMTHLTPYVHQEKFDSPFDYPARTKVFVINDVRKDDLGQVASAYRTLFEASNGGALGLFTAIQRLRAVQEKIASRLEERGLHLYAQHVDMMDNGTLVDIFRDDVNACLLGTDAVRDGVDVPGDSLRLIVFDRVPWPRPTILHKRRREAFGKKQYDERITRLKLKQAFGRLIRRAGDRGVFVMLDPMLPSRLHGAFPPGVEVVKCGLAEAAGEIKKFLAR